MTLYDFGGERVKLGIMKRSDCLTVRHINASLSSLVYALPFYFGECLSASFATVHDTSV
jgi:hypothetical protein